MLRAHRPCLSTQRHARRFAPSLSPMECTICLAIATYPPFSALIHTAHHTDACLACNEQLYFFVSDSI